MVDAINRRRYEGPRRVRHGLKVRRRMDEPLPYPADLWRAALEAPIDPLVRAAGLEYAKAGQIVTFSVLQPDRPGQPKEPKPKDESKGASKGMRTRIEAAVQGRSARPYITAIEIPAWGREQWNRTIESMAREAIYSAKLLSGEIPPGIDALCISLGAGLVPLANEQYEYSCTCIEPKPCKHHAASILLLSERLADAPLLAFDLRGLSHDTVVARLQEARSLHTHGRSTAHGSVATKVAVRPFEACLDDFWRPGTQLDDFDALSPPAHVAHALLRRLGPSPLQGKFPLVGLLASIYESVRNDARRLRTGDSVDA